MAVMLLDDTVFKYLPGVIAEEIDSGAQRIKIYTDSEGNFKGDALIVFKPQSVDMAIMLLDDDTVFRYLPGGTTEGRIRVQIAPISFFLLIYGIPVY